MSDRIVVMSAGRIEQEGSAEEIFERPRTRFVADFMGAQNIFDADVVAADASSAKLRFGGATLAVPEAGLRPGETVGVMIRPEKIRLAAADGAGVPATVNERVYKGSTMSYQLALAAGTRLIADSMHDDHTERFAPGDTVNVAMLPRDLVVLRGAPATA